MNRRSNHLNLSDVFGYLIDLPLATHTPDSIEALILVSKVCTPPHSPPKHFEALRTLHVFQAGPEKALLCFALHVQGIALTDLGRFAEAMVTNAEGSVDRTRAARWMEGNFFHRFARSSLRCDGAMGCRGPLLRASTGFG